MFLGWKKAIKISFDLIHCALFSSSSINSPSFSFSSRCCRMIWEFPLKHDFSYSYFFTSSTFSLDKSPICRCFCLHPQFREWNVTSFKVVPWLFLETLSVKQKCCFFSNLRPWLSCFLLFPVWRVVFLSRMYMFIFLFDLGLNVLSLENTCF